MPPMQSVTADVMGQQWPDDDGPRGPKTTPDWVVVLWLALLVTAVVLLVLT
jgi:hypothetical protein